jgi:hypothetical protein
MIVYYSGINGETIMQNYMKKHDSLHNSPNIATVIKLGYLW